MDRDELEEAGKVGRVAVDYGLLNIPEELADRWTGANSERESLRSLADYFNQRVLTAALSDAGAEATSDVNKVYRVLTEEEGSAGDRTELRNRLTRAGVDVEAVESDFVSHQSIYLFLTNQLNVDHGVDAQPQVEKDINRVNRLESRLTAVTTDVIERSAKAGRIDVGDNEVFVETNVLCSDCGETYSLQSLLERGGCDCS